MSLAKLRPVLYPGRCRVELPALDRRPMEHGAVVFVGHYKSATLDITIQPAEIDSIPISARVSMQNITHYFVYRDHDAILEIQDTENLHRVRFAKRQCELEVMITTRALRYDLARVSLEGFEEFFLWCARATQIHMRSGKVCGLDAEDLALLCGVQPRPIGLQDGAFDGLELVGVEVLGIDPDAGAEADGLQRGIQ